MGATCCCAVDLRLSFVILSDTTFIFAFSVLDNRITCSPSLEHRLNIVHAIDG